MIRFESDSPQQTKQFAYKIAQDAQKPLVLCLYGDLGAGKTVFSKGFAMGLGIPERNIKSPTYTYVRSYNLKNKTLYHYDFYRIEGTDELMAQDLEEIFANKNNYIIIEWPERIQKLLPKKRIDIYFEHTDHNTRTLTMHNHY